MNRGWAARLENGPCHGACPQPCAAIETLARGKGIRRDRRCVDTFPLRSYLSQLQSTIHCGCQWSSNLFKFLTCIISPKFPARKGARQFSFFGSLPIFIRGRSAPRPVHRFQLRSAGLSLPLRRIAFASRPSFASR